jgi:SAM-dependent methyltransferase
MSSMPPPELRPEIAEYYTDRYDESARLTASQLGRLEFERTRDLLLRNLPPAPASVLDIGGGPGVHAEWLAAAGYEVTLLDPVALHREQAAARGGFAVRDGDARALTEHADDSYDAVLLLGPLYHLVERTERIRAIAEARRVARPGAPVAAAAISRHAPLLDVASAGKLDEDLEPFLLQTKATGVNNPTTGFTIAFFHTVDELRDEFAAAGFPPGGEPPGATVYGIEGPVWPLLRSGLAAGREDLFACAVRAARLAETDPALLAVNSHLLAVAYK